MGLTVEGAGHVYGNGTAWAQRALGGVSLTVESGELVAVLGATGSGKSTLLRLMTGLLAPTEGRVLVDDEEACAALARGRVGLVFQRPEAQLFAETVVDDVAFGPRNLGASLADSRVAARAALRAVGLDPAVFGQRSPFTLSGGEARRVAVAGVLAMRPAYLLLDEPTAGLDAHGISGRTFVGGMFRDADDVTGKEYWNGNLESSDIHNLDLRWEIFQKNGQMLSFSGFYKYFIRPIEIVQYATQTGSFQPRNVGDGKVIGIEVEFRQSLDKMAEITKEFQYHIQYICSQNQELN